MFSLPTSRYLYGFRTEQSDENVFREMCKSHVVGGKLTRQLRFSGNVLPDMLHTHP